MSPMLNVQLQAANLDPGKYGVFQPELFFFEILEHLLYCIIIRFTVTLAMRSTFFASFLFFRLYRFF
jgi:hypothetical protein